MRRSMMAVLGAGLLMMAACVPSLHPFYSEKDLASEAGLIGSWGDNKDAKPTWTIEAAAEGKGYRLTDEKGKAIAIYLFKLGDQMFFDFTPQKGSPASEEANFIPVHTMARVKIEKDRLRASFMSVEKVEALLKANPALAAHTRLTEGKDSLLLLTAPTRKLQAFVQKNADKIFPNTAEYFRTDSKGKDASK